MTKLVLLHKASSKYDDQPEARYDVLKLYLRALRETVGNWFLYQEPAKTGPRGHFAAAWVQKTVPHPSVVGSYMALIRDFIPFDSHVPHMIADRPLKAALTTTDGRFKKGASRRVAWRNPPCGACRRARLRGS